MKDLKQRAIRGGAAKFVSTGTSFVVRTGSLMIMARLLDPKDFGLVGMVTAVIGVFNVFRDFGLSTATVQRQNVTEKQVSTLFWINMLVGAILALITLAIAPLVARFYHEPKLIGVTAALASGFVFNAAGVQHTASLERAMRFTTLSVIDIISLLTSTGIGIAMASNGFGYWALVASTVLAPLTYTICVWIAAAWVPGLPHRNVGVRSMMKFGGTITLNGLILYITMNFDKVLLGRYWGVDAVGIYGRAYQLINIPTDNLNSAAGGVAFAALSRVKEDSGRLRNFFLKAYSLILSLTVPIACACALFAEDMILVFLGPKWKEATLIFRLLAPTTLAFAVLNPLGWLLNALGLVTRALKISLVLGPILIMGFLVGLHYGPKGVASAYSIVMIGSIFPLTAWVVRGTQFSIRSVLAVAARPLVSGVIAAMVAIGARLQLLQGVRPVPRLFLETGVLMAFYIGILLFALGQKNFYMELIRSFKSPPVDKILASA